MSELTSTVGNAVYVAVAPGQLLVSGERAALLIALRLVVVA